MQEMVFFLSGSFMRDFGRATYDSAERDKTKDDILKELFKSEGTDKTDTDWYNIFQSNDIDRESYINAVLSSGDHLLVTDSVYRPTRIFCDKMLSRMGVEVTYYDPGIGVLKNV